MRVIDRWRWTRARRGRRVAAPLAFAVVLIAGVGTALAAFSGDGTQTTDFGALDAANGVAIESDGGIVVAGVGGGFAVARYTEDGELDPSFSEDGKKTLALGSAVDVAIQANEKILAVGIGGGKFNLVRFTGEGALDDSFSGNGKVATGFPGDGAARPEAVAIQPDGRIVVGGGVTGKIALARYRKNGELDDTFSGNGKRTTDFGPEASAHAFDVALAPDGKIVTAGGTSAAKNDTEYLVTRHKPNGSLDRSFTGDGMRKVNFAPGCCSFAHAVAVQSNGRIVAVGHSDRDFALARLRQSGKRDRSFSGDGLKTTDFRDTAGVDLDVGEAVIIQPNDRIVVVGHTAGEFGLARYLKGGSLDESFSDNGKQTTNIASGASARDGAIQDDGKIVAVGLIGHPEYDFALARYLANGGLDD